MDLKLFSLEAGVVSGLFLFVPIGFRVDFPVGPGSVAEKLVTNRRFLLSFPASA